MPGAVLPLAWGLFALNALAEALITFVVVESVDRLHPGWIRRMQTPRPAVTKWFLAASLVLAVVGVAVASAAPDGLERLAENLGIAHRARVLWETPLADYEARFLSGSWVRRAAAALAGIGITAAVLMATAKLLQRRRSV
jgi:cobalt/nickel transport system permease protein